MLLYRCLIPLISLAFIMRAIWAALRGEETFSDLKERVTGPTARGPAIWVHGASVGEMNAARPIITALASDGPVLVTATTVTGRSTVRQWAVPGVTVGLAPLDWRFLTRRLIRRNKVQALIIIENELWPNRIIAFHKAKLPVLMINARMSKSSARTWGRFGTLARNLLGSITLAAPQDAVSADRLVALGLPQSALTAPINLKGLYAPNLSAIPDHLRQLNRARTILAAATHDGEEAIMLDAFLHMREARPDLQLIIAPRHPVRSADVVKLIEARGLSCAYRSSDDAPDQPVFLADTLGEMHMWYRLSGVAFIGGSLVEKGGHTPFEPAAYDCPILHGPHVANFAEAYAKLDAARGAQLVTGAETLAKAALEHLNDTEMAERANVALDQPDVAPLLTAIRAALNPSA